MSTQLADDRCTKAFRDVFGGSPTDLSRAPGRVELLGNHTDYNGGLVLAAAIDRFTVVAGRADEGRAATVRAENFDATDRFDLDAIERGPEGVWGRYVRGVAWALQETMGSFNSGFSAAIAGNVPLGAGLSSSASLQAALALFLLRAGLVPNGSADLDDPARLALARVLQRSENAFVGVASGLLDQFSVLFGRQDHALMLDCRDLAFERLPLGNPAPAIVVCDSKTSRRLADGMYNQRRRECETVVTYFQRLRGETEIRWLRDITHEELIIHWNDLDPVGRIRARHVITENARVEQGAEALRAGDLARFGRLMSASHASSRDDFGNSAAALDALIASAEESPGFLGGKLSGAGWAGCTVNLVEADQAAAFAESVTRAYAQRSGVVPEVHICRAADGAQGERLADAKTQ
jgi:galactokinase